MSIPYAPTSWNPTTGCTAVSEGCVNCWARTLHEQRYGAWHLGAKLPQQYQYPFEMVQLLPGRLDQPLRWRTPRTVAVCFMGDLFHEDVPFAFLDNISEVMTDTPQHTYLILTKRPGRMRDYFHDWRPTDNVWLGVTAENQERADERIPVLLDTPAAHRWVSLEPALGAVDLTRIMGSIGDHVDLRIDSLAGRYAAAWGGRDTRILFDDPQVARLDWIVVGGESGPGYREMDPAWVEHISAQCAVANVPYYGKQRAATRAGQPLLGHLGRKETPWPAAPQRPPGEAEPPQGEE